MNVKISPLSMCLKNKGPISIALPLAHSLDALLSLLSAAVMRRLSLSDSVNTPAIALVIGVPLL